MDLGWFMRERFARYVAVLAESAHRHGIARSAVHDQHSRHRRGERGAVRDRGQPAVPRLRRPRRVSRRVRPLPGRDVLGHDLRHPLRQRRDGSGRRSGPAADLAGVRGRQRRLRRRTGPALRSLDRRPEDPALPGPGQPADQLLPAGRRGEPAAGQPGGRRQRPDQLHRGAARDRGPDRTTRRARPDLRRDRSRGAGRHRQRPLARRSGRGVRRPHRRLLAGRLHDRVPPPGQRADDRRRRRPRRAPGRRRRARPCGGRCCTRASGSARPICRTRRHHCRVRSRSAPGRCWTPRCSAGWPTT